MGLDKNSTDARPSTVKIYFCFWLRNYYHEWDLEKCSRHPTITDKQIFVVSVYTVLCMELKKMQSILDPTDKRNCF